MKAARYDFTIPRGEDFAKDFEFPSIDLQGEGWTVELVIGTTTTLKSGAGLIVTGHKVSVSMSKAKTAEPPNFHRDPFKLVLINPAGEDATYIKGMATWQTQ